MAARRAETDPKVAVPAAEPAADPSHWRRERRWSAGVQSGVRGMAGTLSGQRGPRWGPALND